MRLLALQEPTEYLWVDFGHFGKTDLVSLRTLPGIGLLILIRQRNFKLIHCVFNGRPVVDEI